MKPILKGERALLVGRTGTGKSTLGRCLLAQAKQFIIIADPKGDFDFPNCKVIENPEELSDVRRSEETGVIYRPSPEFDFLPMWDLFFQWVYRFRDCALYVDEIYGVMQESRSPHWLKACLTRGRSLQITTIASTQRPFSIPMPLLTESDHRFMFALSLLDDKKRMAELMPGCVLVGSKEVPTVLRPLKGPHNFYYYYIKSDEMTREFCLKLNVSRGQNAQEARTGVSA